MTPLLGHILLALAWVAITGDFSLANFLLGLAAGLAILWIAGDIIGARRYTRRFGAAIRLAGVFLWEALLANLRVARDVVTPGMRATPVIVEVELDAKHDIELLLLSMLLTLTPGTVVVHISHDRERMYVYAMYGEDPDALAASIKRTFERRVLAVTRAEALP